MIFTIELTNRLTTYRLQTNSKWRNTDKDVHILASDVAASTPDEVITRSTLRQCTILIDGIKYDVEMGRWPTENESLNYDSLIFRKTFPALPQRQQLVEAIRRGDDSRNNSLILNHMGIFEVRPSPPFDHHFNDPSVICRHETSMRGNGYIGPGAISDNSYVNDVYQSSMEWWLVHLKSGTTQHYSDSPATQSLDSILKELDSLQKNWIAQY